MHILHIVNNCNEGGVGNVIIPMIERLKNDEMRFTVAYLKKPDSLKEVYAKLGVNTFLLGTNPIFIFFRLLRFKRKTQFPISLIHTHLVHASLVGRIFGKIFNIPVLTTRHYHKRSKKYDPLYLLEDLSLKYSDFVIPISNAVKDHIVDSNYVPSKKCQVIYNPVDLDLFLGHKPINLEVRINILCNARWIKIKGIEYLLDAFEKIGEILPDAHLILIGRNEHAKSLNKKISTHPFKDKIEIKGFIPRKEIMKELSKTRIYVQPSLLEGLGLSAIEAMGMGTPCIFSATGGLIELSNNNNNAVLIPSGNSKLLGENIISLWNNINKSVELSTNAKFFVEEYFDADKIAMQYLNAYKQSTQISN